MTRILIVDDSEVARRHTANLLQERHGLEIVEAADGFDALKVLAELSVELVICDYEMPRMNGLQLVQAIRARSNVNELPILVLTSRAAASDKVLLLRAGANDYVTKPVEPEELSARVAVQLELQTLQRALLKATAQSMQSQKLQAIGQLAAGVAHEINTPIQYIGDNVSFLQSAFADFQRLVEAMGAAIEAARDKPLTTERAAELERLVSEVDSEYLADEIPHSIAQALDGVGNVARIVSAMKEFAHPREGRMSPHDLNRALKGVVTVARNEWKYVAEVQLDLDDNLPAVSCLPGEINQVFLNLLVNAAHAVADKGGDGVLGTIAIRTRALDGTVEVRVEDSGTGVPQSVIDRIFDPFFTTKKVGRGTGQGLSIARATVVEKHGGELTLETDPGRGTTFIVRLPIEQPAAAAEEVA